jgi:hypothetical protein
VIVILPVAWLLQGVSARCWKKSAGRWKTRPPCCCSRGAKAGAENLSRIVRRRARAGGGGVYFSRNAFPFVKQLGWPKLAWFGTSALFALIHADAAIFVPLFVLALALTWLYEFTDNLLAPIVAHSLFNAANLVVLIFRAKMK